MNTYFKFTTNVFLAKCTEKHEKGEVIEVTTKRGKKVECIVFKLVLTKEDGFYYSIVRKDGYNVQERAKKKAEKYNDWAISAKQKEQQYFELSKEGASFLSLGEPIKVGHHSEKAHRNLIERNNNRIRKSIELDEKAASHLEKSEYWANKTNEINLSMPESFEYYTKKLDEAKKYHLDLKTGKAKRDHAFTLTYAKKEVNELTKKVELAKRLWVD